MKMFNKKPENKHDLIYIDGRGYAIEKSTKIEVQSVPSDVNVYGWTIEIQTTNTDNLGNKTWSNWLRWSKKIYSTRNSAITAAIQTGGSYFKSNDYRYKVIPLYSMNEQQFRDYKLDLLLSNSSQQIVPKVYEIKFWRLMEDYEEKLSVSGNIVKFRKGQLWARLETGEIMLVATPDRCQFRSYSWWKSKLEEKGLLEEVDIMTQKWAHPHLMRELKLKFGVR